MGNNMEQEVGRRCGQLPKRAESNKGAGAGEGLPVSGKAARCFSSNPEPLPLSSAHHLCHGPHSLFAFLSSG